MIVAIKTDNPTTELYVLDSDGDIRSQEVWESGRQLSAQLLGRLEDLLRDCRGTLSEVSGLIVYRGPGSFTGLRIGLSVANAIAYSNHAQIVDTTGENWLQDGMEQLRDVEPGGQILPEYGAQANITRPRK